MTSAASAVPAQNLDLLTFDLNCSSLIEASAGTGKTYTITYLILRLLLNAGCSGNLPEPLKLENILVVTFTNAAAADLKLRIREKIRDARACFTAALKNEDVSSFDDTMRRLLQILQQEEQDLAVCCRVLQRAERDIDKAAICTIHSFCNSALNQIYAFEAGEAFETELCADLSALEDEAFNQIWRECFYQDKKHEPEADLLLQLLGSDSPAGVREVYKQLMQVRLSGPDKNSVLSFAVRDNTLYFDRRRRRAATLLQDLRSKAARVINKTAAEFAAAKEQLAVKMTPEVLGLLQQGARGKAPAAGLFARTDDTSELPFNQKNGQIILRRLLQLWAAEQYPPAAAEKYDLDGVDAEKMISRGKSVLKKLENANEVQALFAAVLDFIAGCDALRRQVSALGSELRTALAMCAFERFEELKDQRQVMNYDDVLLRLNRALHQPGRGDRLAAMIRQRYAAAMIDEFQDTDPVQYAIFEKLYLQEDGSANAARCYLIGDPKQSIYSFRGSDINSYLKAYRRIAALSRGRAVYTLSTNYRSAPRVVQSVNALFSSELNPDNPRPFLTEEVQFSPVEHSSGRRFFCFKDGSGNFPADYHELPACYVSLLDPAEEKLSKTKMQPAFARLCALQIKRCLTDGVIVENGRPRAVRPGDIAVLVRSAGESSEITAQLRLLNISGVFYSDKSSVLQAEGRPTQEAQEIFFLMDALCDCSSRQKVSRLLGSRLLSLTGAEFIKMQIDEVFEKEVRLLGSLQREWQQNGFLPAFLRWFKDPLHQGLQRALRFTDGDRLLTNYQHIAELVQQMHGRISGIKPQLRWFVNLINNEQHEDNRSADETVQRLESERDQVQVRTIHNSKGLEFTLVMMPFLWLTDGAHRSNTAGGVVYHDQQTGRRTLDLYSREDSSEAVEEAEAQEDMRLTYVALTRACAANFLFMGPLTLRSGQSVRSFIRLLCGSSDLSKKTIPDVDRVARELQKRRELFVCENYQATDLTAVTAPYQPPKQEPPELAVSVLPPAAVNSDFSISSYSAIVSGLHDKPAAVPVMAEEAREQARESAEELQPPELSAFDFPRGTSAGSFLHRLLQELPFGSSMTLESLQARCLQALTTYGRAQLAAWTMREGDGVAALGRWLYDMVHAVILEQGGRPVRLCDLKAGGVVTEMSYLMPAHGLDSLQLNDLCRRSAACDLKLEPSLKEAVLQAMYLSPRQISGFLTGSLDLVFCSPHPGQRRYFVTDYKSTYLGPAASFYDERALQLSVYDRRCRYDVQYLIYTLVLHRFLKKRIPDYSYERDMGGVLYLYLRGLQAGDGGISTGVYYTKPALEVIEELDRMAGGIGE